jgi:hypothetical protein
MPKGRTAPKINIAGKASGFAQKTWKHGLLLVLFIGGLCMACSWMLNDISGEYGANDGRSNVIHMSIIRKATTVNAELSIGSGPLLVAAQQPYASAGDTIDWTFATPQKWVDNGQKRQKVTFHGTIQDGVVKGVLQDGIAVLPIKLPRDGIASIYRMLQSHLPWVS